MQSSDLLWLNSQESNVVYSKHIFFYLKSVCSVNTGSLMYADAQERNGDGN